MNNKLLASIAVFVLLTAVASVLITQSAYAAEDTKAKAKALKEDTKAKAKALKEEAKSTTTASDTITIEMAKGSSTPGCEATSSCYLPNPVTVKTGAKVTWKNTDSAAHTVTSGKDATPDGTFDSSMVMAGKSFSYTFKTAGTYNYYCAVHPWMTGVVTVN
ncbi:MAG TPA: plastocyanin/azurin family copper-binding protein [Candidatus Nitrosotenuis sp.]|nr:plastocyanin/azurin family copper-binding protein [Candidatus Nitrosotenuis sp.]